MPVVTIGTSGASWGLTAETGVIVQGVTAKAQREKNMVRNEQGDVALVAFYNPTQTYSINGVTLSTSGIAAAAPGVVLTVANSTGVGSYGGTTAGGIYTDDVDVQGSNTDFRKITVNATRYPLIT
jgi:hypothetical protein